MTEDELKLMDPHRLLCEASVHAEIACGERGFFWDDYRPDLATKEEKQSVMISDVLAYCEELTKRELRDMRLLSPLNDVAQLISSDLVCADFAVRGNQHFNKHDPVAVKQRDELAQVLVRVATAIAHHGDSVRSALFLRCANEALRPDSGATLALDNG